MTTDWNKPEGSQGSPSPDRTSDRPREDAATARAAFEREAGEARRQAGEGYQAAKEEAASLAAKARERAGAEAERGKDYAASNIEDFAAAIRKASDELGGRDQSMAANLVRHAAGGLEDVSRSIKGQSVEDMARAVSSFARRQPAAFLIGAALAGVAIGRFARASGEHADDRYRDDDRYVGGRGYDRSDERFGYGADRPSQGSRSVYSGGTTRGSDAARPASSSTFGASGTQSPGSAGALHRESGSPSGTVSGTAGAASGLTGTGGTGGQGPASASGMGSGSTTSTGLSGSSAFGSGVSGAGASGSASTTTTTTAGGAAARPATGASNWGDTPRTGIGSGSGSATTGGSNDDR